MKGSQVAIRDLTFGYGQTTVAALRHVSLHVKHSETVVILGPSGCGKSTLLRSVNRLITPQSGSVEIDGIDIAHTDLIALRRSIGYVIQSAGLFPHLRVAENIGFVPSLLGWSHEKVRQRVDTLLHMVDLDPTTYRNRRPASLSGGQAQRVGVARALAAHPRLLLMDEPFGALDPVVRRSLQGEMRTIIKQSGTTTIFVTHDVDEALHLADRIVVMHDGCILQDATPLDILRSPANERVESLLGTQSLARRLALITVKEALVASTPQEALPELLLPLDATLDQALNAFLAHASASAFRVGDHGVLSFASLAQAIA